MKSSILKERIEHFNIKKKNEEITFQGLNLNWQSCKSIPIYIKVSKLVEFSYCRWDFLFKWNKKETHNVNRTNNYHQGFGKNALFFLHYRQNWNNIPQEDFLLKLILVSWKVCSVDRKQKRTTKMIRSTKLMQPQCCSKFKSLCLKQCQKKMLHSIVSTLFFVNILYILIHSIYSSQQCIPTYPSPCILKQLTHPPTAGVRARSRF